MPKRTDIKSILIIGAGPIVIGQACEFDYSGVQACHALREEGYKVILVNSNPATIMTDSDIADKVYIEPVHYEVVTRIIEIEKPDAILPTMGGQTALNCALDLASHGILEQHNIELIGASRDAIDKAEDREQFRLAMHKIGLETPSAAIAHSLEEALQVQSSIGFPTIIRPSFTLGGSGSGIAYNKEEFINICERGLELSPTNELLIEESLLGWKEYELEVVRDKNDNCIIVCSIENVDPLGVHTGDSIAVAPQQTLTDREYQKMRNASIAILKEIGVETGGSNVQFGICPKTGRMVVIEMNPRVSRSSALASKATGFPIAKVAAKLAVGYTLDELKNEITGSVTPISFEPSLDYVVVKIPYFNFDKFPQSSTRLTTQMRSVGEVMAIGRTFPEALQKAIRGGESSFTGLNEILGKDTEKSVIKGHLMEATPKRLWHIADAMRLGMPLDEINNLSKIDGWFLSEIKTIVDTEENISTLTLEDIDKNTMQSIKAMGFSDRRLGQLLTQSESEIRAKRISLNVRPVYKRIDTSAAEFKSSTAYMYSTYETNCEALPTSKKKVIILGGGPNRIGQGIEFDYCCVHAAMALSELNIETIMINCNPETVSTDYNISDRLYFEPVTLEDVLEIAEVEKPMGVIVQFGGQTPLKIARALEAHGVTILGTNPDAIDIAEDRERFGVLANTLQLLQPKNAIARSFDEAKNHSVQIGYPIVARPSYVLGGRAMEIIYSEDELRVYYNNLAKSDSDAPILIDQFLVEAIEVDIDAVADGDDVFIGGIMEHIEQAGIHSGDSSCTLPPFSISTVIQEDIKGQLRLIAKKLGVIGLINAQFAIQGEDIYILEVNPRASRTVPFVSKAIGVPLAKVATKCIMGVSLAEQEFKEMTPDFYSIKMPVFPFEKFEGVDCLLGPEMKSTGEVMGIANRFGQAYAKAQLGANMNIKRRRKAFVSVRKSDKPHVAEIGKRLVELGFTVLATSGTEKVLFATGIPATRVNKVIEGRPHIVDMIKNDEIDFIVNTTEGAQAISDSFEIRESAIKHKVSYTTTISGAKAACLAMKYEDRQTVKSLQQIHKKKSKITEVLKKVMT